MQFAIVGKDHELYAGEGWNFSEQEKERIISAVQKKDVYAEIYHHNFLNNSMVVSMKSKMFGWRVIGIKKLQEITDMNLKMLMISGVTILIAVILVQILSKRVSKRVLQPMNHLIEECNRVAEGDYGVIFSEKRSQEVAFLSDTIKSMVNHVVQLTNQVVEEEKKVSEEKLRVLQHQINPHFLNNVLQTIKALAVEGDTDKISRMSTLLGHILAYSVYEPYECVPLKTELEYLRNYIELQNIRYENRILYSVDCEEQVEQVQIPKLTLQPLVENSIEHGFSPKTRLMINVSAEGEDRSGNQESGLLSEQVASYSKPVRESLALIEERYNENLSLEEICEKIAVSKTYFCYLFKRETGMSLWNYLTFVRLNHARELLETTELKNYEIAFQVGYENPSYFSRLFKKYEGVTPNEYRAAKRNIVTE